MAELRIRINDELSESLAQLAKKRGISLNELMKQVAAGFLFAEGQQMGQRLKEDEMRIVRHFNNVDLLQDLQFLGTRDAQLVKRELDSAILFYRDKSGRLPMEVHQFRMKGDKQFDFTAVSLEILGYCASHLLPKALRSRLIAHSEALSGKATDIGSALTLYLSKLYKPKPTDKIGDEVNEEFESMMQDATQKEAYDRGTK